jgi:hypothetical protein
MPLALEPQTQHHWEKGKDIRHSGPTRAKAFPTSLLAAIDIHRI